MLSTSCKAAIKAVVFLASQFEPGEKFSLTMVSQHIGASEHTVGKILQALVKNKLIKSSKGPGGGFYITKEQLEIPVIKIVQAIDGKELFKECALGLNKCNSERPCPIHFEYKKAREVMEQIFLKNKIADLCRPVSEKQAWLM